MTILTNPTRCLAPPIGTVELFDGMVPEGLQRDILRLVRRPIWAYGWKSVRDHDRYGFWHAHFAGGDEAHRESCEEELASNLKTVPIQELWSLLSGTLLRGHVPFRVYANGHTYGVEGYVHTDTADPDCYTTIYYAHGVWDANWAGETVFFCEANGDITRAVAPKPGRLITFCGATPHAARSASRECPELRVSVVFKTRYAPAAPDRSDA